RQVLAVLPVLRVHLLDALLGHRAPALLASVDEDDVLHGLLLARGRGWIPANTPTSREPPADRHLPRGEPRTIERSTPTLRFFLGKSCSRERLSEDTLQERTRR